MVLVSSLLLMILGSLSLGFAAGIEYVKRKLARQSEAHAAWEAVVATYRSEPFMQHVQWPPEHKRLIN